MKEERYDKDIKPVGFKSLTKLDFSMSAKNISVGKREMNTKEIHVLDSIAKGNSF